MTLDTKSMIIIITIKKLHLLQQHHENQTPACLDIKQNIKHQELRFKRVKLSVSKVKKKSNNPRESK